MITFNKSYNGHSNNIRYKCILNKCKSEKYIKIN